MKKNLFLAAGLLCLPLLLLAQSPGALQVREFVLGNGMKVWVNVDHSQPKVFGAVVVNAGAVDCPDTGIAHYFEHIMFKGTDELGTTDYAAEKVYLDSISMKYDELALTATDKGRQAIQQDINRLNVEASRYAIPNEFNRLTTLYGGSDLNAGTSYDFTFYHNTFAPQYIEQWCQLNSHRLIHPVFRMFQGELETVYEEKNMYSDNPAAMLLEQITSKFFAGTPYAYPIVGSTQSLKNPKLSEMEAFYKKYYVASNMGLILAGDIDTAGLQPLLERTFGRLERGSAPVRMPIQAPAITGQPVEKVLFPMPIIGMSAMVFRGPTDFDADAPAIKVAVSLLSNENKTGLLDELANNNRVYIAAATHMAFNNAGALAVMVVPKLLCKVKTAENLCLAQVEKLLNGEFTDEQLKAAKQTLMRDNEMEMETIAKRSELMVTAMAAGVSWEHYMNRLNGISRITRDDVIAAARKYFTQDFMRFHKKNGRVPVEKIAKPDYTPAVPQHGGEQSAFARQLEQIPAQSLQPRLLDFDRDVDRVTMTTGNVLYADNNPVNDIFTLVFNFHKGTKHDKLLEAATDYVQTLGTDSLDIKSYGMALQQLGATVEMASDRQSTLMTITGLNSNFEATLNLFGHFLGHVKADKEKLSDLKDAAGPSEKSFWDENTSVFMALFEKVVRGQQSSCLNRLTAKALKKVTAEQLIESFHQMLDYRCEVGYTGDLPANMAAQIITRALPQLTGAQDNVVEELVLETPERPTVYVFDMPKSRQTLVGLYRPLPQVTSDRDKACLEFWGEYFGGGMSSVLFQEVREFRSLAYASQGRAITPALARSTAPSAYVALIGTQSDKAMQATALLDSLVDDMPLVPQNVDVARQSLLNDVNNSYPSFRGKPLTVLLSERCGYKADENEALVRVLPTLTQADLESFYRNHIQGKPCQLIIVGNLKTLDLKQLGKYGTVVKVKKDDIYKTKEPKK